MRRIQTLFVVILLLAAVGCANPADDKPAAVVGEATPQGTPSSVGGGTRFQIGEGSTIGFTGSKITGKHDGGFHAFEGEIQVVDGAPEQSSVNLSIDTRSLWADNDRLSGHLKSPDFFDVEKFPSATFRSTSIVREDDLYSVTGNLDLHGVTKSITFPARIVTSPTQVTAQAEFKIKRFDFNIEYKGKADDLIRDDVVIRFDLKAAPAAG